MLKNGSEDMLEVAVTHDGKRMIYGNWSGDVFNTPIAMPDETVRLAANPEPAEKRVDAVKSALASIREKLAPAKVDLERALKEVATAEQALSAFDQKIAALRTRAAEAEAASKQASEDAAKFDRELPGTTSAIRDLQDEVTALRVSLKRDASRMIAVAEAEEKLAERLHQIAKQRRDRIAMQIAVESHRQTLATNNSKADQLAAARPEHEQKFKQARQRADLAQKTYDEIAAEALKIESKMERLLAEIR
jgi:chromosome segregation ATPase